MLTRSTTTADQHPPAPAVSTRASVDLEPDDELVGVEPRPAKAIVPGTEWIVRAVSGPLRRLWRRGFRFLFVLDAVGLFGSMVVINFARFGREWPTYSRSFYLGGFLAATAIHLVINYFYGLYEREPRLGRRPWLPRSIVATGIGVGIQAVAFVFLDRYLMPRLNLAIFMVVGSIVLTANRRISRRLATRRQGPPRVVLVGDPADVARASVHIAATEREVELVGHVGEATSLVETVRDGSGTDVLLLDAAALDLVFPEPMATLEAEGIGFFQTVAARDALLGLKSLREIAGMPFVPLRVHGIPSHKARFKRLFDLVLTIVTLPITVLAVGALALYVLLRAGRPVLFRQTRVGKDGDLFRVVKFRTMTVDAERHGAQLATADDARVVAGLRWMRETRADELPQLWNVLRGQMSLVGPRPERPELTTDIEREVAGWVMRHQLPPGLTGLAQVNGRYATSAEYKIGYDLQYVVNWSPILDLQILAQTVWVVLSRHAVTSPADSEVEAADWPSVSVVMPVRNEADHLDAAVRAVLAQRYPGPLEIVVAVAPSVDGTENIAAGLADGDDVVVVDNPRGLTPTGLNSAIRASSGEIVVRVDGHSELSEGYIERAVQTLRRTGAVNVGGVQRAVGRTSFERAVATAMTSRFGTGDAAFHYGGDEGPTDTVYLGVFDRQAIEAVGLYDDDLVRNQDYELNIRLRDAGGVVWFDPRLEVTYRPRGSVRALAQQYFDYGKWKRVVLRRHPGSLRWRQAIPPAATAAIAVCALVGIVRPRALVVPFAYAAAVVAAASTAGSTTGERARLSAIFPTMHLSWGAGFLVGARPSARHAGRP